MINFGVFISPILIGILVYIIFKSKVAKRGWKKSSIRVLGGLLSIVVWFVSSGVLITSFRGAMNTETMAALEKEAAEREAKENEEAAEREAKKNAEIVKGHNPVYYAKHHQNPEADCKRAIAGLAKYDFRWLSDTDIQTFDRYRWHKEEDKVIDMLGDRAQAQNGFSAYQRVTYICRFNADTGQVLYANFEGVK